MSVKIKKQHTVLLMLSVVGSYVWGSILFVFGGLGFIYSGELTSWNFEGQTLLEAVSLWIMVCALLWAVVVYMVQKYYEPARIILILIWVMVGIISTIYAIEFVLKFIEDYSPLDLFVGFLSETTRGLFWYWIFVNLLLGTAILEIYTLAAHKETYQLFLKTSP
ncbi:MAG: hypothetical protein ACXACP_06635 [Candidatus Hodarchaeales archaeon]|jgi:hypothetical protein